MNSQKPTCIAEYKEWLAKEHDVNMDQTRTRYESLAALVGLKFEESDFWSELSGNLKEYDDEYLVSTGYNLLMGGFVAVVHVKPFDSLLLKAFRQNILGNERWPEAPEGGWILPDNWYSRINDIVRTLFVVKYIDGVEFLSEKIRSLCGQHGAPCEASLEAREEGYYAAHLLTRQTFEIPGPFWDTIKVDMSVEMQITTQLQEVIRRLLHKYYESSRQSPGSRDTKWQWDYKSDEFATSYLGHILHYVEGMIMDIRERQTRRPE